MTQPSHSPHRAGRHPRTPRLAALTVIGLALLGAPLALLPSDAAATPPSQAGGLAEAIDPFDWLASPPTVTADPHESLAPMLERVLPAVVSIQAFGVAPDVGLDTLRGPGSGFMPPRMIPDDMPRGIGSGFIIEADGLVVTNYHVVAGAKKLEARLADGRRFEGTIVGTDPQTDTALVQLKGAKALSHLEIATVVDARVGDWVVAVGSPMGLEQTVTRGIVSAKGRGDLGLYRNGYVDFVQTDAAISPGSSGGPLVDLQGRVVGMNTAISGQGRGLGFAVPSAQLVNVVPQLKKHGKVERGWLGLSGREVQAASYGELPLRGATIAMVYPGTPAADAGLKNGDRVLAVGAHQVENFADFRGRIAEVTPGKSVDLKIVRGGKEQSIKVKVGKLPDEDTLARIASGLDGGDGKGSDANARGGTDSRGSALYGKGKRKLGVEVTPQPNGMKVEKVGTGSVAEQLGLREGDILREINGKKISAPGDVAAAIELRDNSVEVTVERDGGTHSAAIMRR